MAAPIEDKLLGRSGGSLVYMLDERDMTAKTAHIYLQKQGFSADEAMAYLQQLGEDYLAKRRVRA